MSRLPQRIGALGFVLAASASAGPLSAQDTTKAIDNGGVRVILEYNPGVRPGIVVLPATGLDSARAIVQRDLDYSDRFEVVTLSNEGGGVGSEGGGVSYGIYKSLGAAFGVELTTASGGVMVRLHDVTAGRVRNQQAFTLPATTDPSFRLEVHRIADEVTRWATGTPGAAASRLLLVSGGRIYQIDRNSHLILRMVDPRG